MAQNYHDLSQDELARLLEARDREAKRGRRFGLVWERDAIEHEAWRWNSTRA